MFTVFQDESESKNPNRNSVRTQVTPVAHVGTHACTSLLSFTHHLLYYILNKTNRNWIGSHGQSSLSAIQRHFRCIYFFLSFWPERKFENPTRCVIYHCLSSPIAYSSAILYTQGFCFSRKITRMVKKKINNKYKNTHSHTRFQRKCCQDYFRSVNMSNM